MPAAAEAKLEGRGVGIMARLFRTDRELPHKTTGFWDSSSRDFLWRMCECVCDANGDENATRKELEPSETR